MNLREYKKIRKAITSRLDSMREENLHKWFQSRSTNGTPGWVQVVSGKPCARQPGQKSTPKCVSSSKRASIDQSSKAVSTKKKKKSRPKPTTKIRGSQAHICSHRLNQKGERND